MANQQVLSIFDELKELHKAKDNDYAGGEPLSNFKKCEQFGIPAWKGCLIRLSDKYSRIISLISKDGQHKVTDESLEDTLKDLAVYSIITLALLKETKPTVDTQVKTEVFPTDIPTQEEIAKLRIDLDKKLSFHEAAKTMVQGMDETERIYKRDDTSMSKLLD